MGKQTPLRAAIYARVSSATQREAQTIDAQLKALPEYISRQGWTLVATFTDDGTSAKAGSLKKRRGLQRMLAAAEAGTFDIVVVWDVDRLTRSEDQAERGLIIGRIMAAGVRVATYTGGLLDPRASDGDLILSVQAWSAAEWLRKHRERIKAGKLRAIAEGRKPAGPTPYGLKYDRATGEWSIDPVLGPIVREIFERVAAGESTETIARDLDRRGVWRPRGKWNRERVWDIVRRETAKGIWYADKRKGLRMNVPPMVSTELWDAAQDALARWKLRGLKKTRYVYLCGDIARCGLCGAPIGISSASTSGGGRWRRPAYYVCARRRRPDWGGARCMLPMRRTADIDALVWDKVSKFLKHPDLVDRMLARRGSQARNEGADWRKDVTAYQEKLDRLDRAEAAILERFRRGKISERAMDRELDSAGKERAMLDRQLATAREAGTRAEVHGARVTALRDAIGSLRARVSDATPEIRRALVRALVPGTGEMVITIGPEKVRLAGRFAAAPSIALASEDDSSSAPRAMASFELSFPLVA